MPAPQSARSIPGLAVRRALADPGLVAISALVVLVAATALVAAAVHPSSAAARGAIRRLQAADPAAASVVISGDVPVADLARVDARVREILADALGSLAGTVSASARSESFGQAGVDGGPLIVLDAADDLVARTRLVAGTWPETGATPPGVVLTNAAAGILGVGPGGHLSLEGRSSPDKRLELVVTGVVEVLDRTDPAWAADTLALDGTITVGPFTTVGPLYVDSSVLQAGEGGVRVRRTWVARPSFASVPVASLGSLAAGTRTIPERLTAALGARPALTVTTGLPEILGGAVASLDRAGSGSAAVAGPLAAIATVTLLLVAMLLVERRRGGTALLRARGAGTAVLLRLAAAEAALLAAAAGLVGLPAGILVARLVDGSEGWGSGLLPVTAGPTALLGLAGVVVVISLLGLLAPTLGSVGPIAELRRLARRRKGGTAAARWGVDLALLVVAGLLVAQLLARGATGPGAAPGNGLGTLEMATPGVVVLAGALLSLRVTPLVARLAGALGGRQTGAAGALGGWSVARRVDTHATVAMLLAGATATVILAGAISQSWAAAQRDQVAHELAADLRGTVGGLADAPRPGARTAYLAIPGITAASPVIAAIVDAGAGLHSTQLLAIPGSPTLTAAALRDDLAAEPAASLLAGLAAARPPVLQPSADGTGMLGLPAGTTSVRVTAESHLETGGLPPALAIALVVIAPDGTLVRTQPAPLTDGSATVTLPEAATGVLAVEVVVSPTSGAPTTGTIRVMEIHGAAAQPATGAWSFTRTAFGISAGPVAAAPGEPATATFGADDPIAGPGATIIAYRPAGLADLPAAALPALVDDALAAAAAGQSGADLAVRLGMAETRHLAPAGTVRSFPGTSGPGVAVVDLGTWQAAGYAAGGTVPGPTAWWFATDGAHDDAVAAALAGGAYPLTGIRAAGAMTADRVADPVADAVLGSLGLVAAGALLVALLGLVAASASGMAARRGDLAVSLALGLERRGLVGWILAEELFPVVAGMCQGVALGALAAVLLVPALVASLGGHAAVPPVRVELPWALAGGVLAVGGALGLALAANRARVTWADRIAATLRRGAAGDGT